jgi:subtilase family serine protease
VFILLLSVALGTLLQRPHVGAHAVTTQSATNSITTGKPMAASIVPMQPMYEMAVKMDAKANNVANVTNATNAMTCLASAQLPLCYSPQQIRTAYGVQPLLAAGITGKGRIITIIDAFQSPTLRADLHRFDQLFGLKDPQLNIIAPFGLTPFNAKDPIQTAFAGEISLDVEWAHAIAPDATIDLVLANVKQETIQGELSALLQATQFAVKSNIGSVISQSFGASEACLGPAFLQASHKLFQLARVHHQTVFASAGDSGAGVVQCDANGNPVTLAQGVNYPASDPLVTSVGGTTLLAARSGAYIRETTWNESRRGNGATGGGVSMQFALPTFQQNIVNSQMRGAADLSLVADPLTGVPVVTSSLMPGTTLIVPVGGTSIGAPVAAGMTALFDQAAGKRLGFLNGAFYRVSQSAAYAQVFHDVKVGNNTFVFKAANGGTAKVTGFKAAMGWDAPTGIGTPKAANLSALLPQLIKPNDGATL